MIGKASSRREREDKNADCPTPQASNYHNSIRVKLPQFQEGDITLFRIGSYSNILERCSFLPCTANFAVVEFFSVSGPSATINS